MTKGASGRDVLRVTSPRPVTEPFVTLLVEANWPRGRLLREYTVLLDPPVYAPASGGTAAPAVAAPRASLRAARPAAATTEPVADDDVRAEPPRAPTRPAAPAAAAHRTGQYLPRPTERHALAHRQRGASRHTLGRQSRDGVDLPDQPAARSTATSTCCARAARCAFPRRTQLDCGLRRSGVAEVARQYDAWRNGATVRQHGAAATEAGRLRLVTPEQGTSAPSTATQSGSSRSRGNARADNAGQAPRRDADLDDARVKQLETELAEAVDCSKCAMPNSRRCRAGAPRPAPANRRPSATATRARRPRRHGDAAAPAAEHRRRRAGASRRQSDKPKKPTSTLVPNRRARACSSASMGYWWVLLGAAGCRCSASCCSSACAAHRGSAEDRPRRGARPRDCAARRARTTPRSRERRHRRRGKARARRSRAWRRLAGVAASQRLRAPPEPAAQAGHRSRTRFRATARRAWNPATRWRKPTSTWRTACTTRPPTSCSSR